MSNEEKDTSLEPNSACMKSADPSQETAESSDGTDPEAASDSHSVAIDRLGTTVEQQVTASGLPSPSKVDAPRTESLVAELKQETPASLLAAPEHETPTGLNDCEGHEESEASNRRVDPKEPLQPAPEPAPRNDEVVKPVAAKSLFVVKRHGLLEERTLPVVEIAPQTMRRRTRREVLAFGIGMVAMASGAVYLLPKATLNRVGFQRDLSSRGKEWLLNNALRVDDDVAEALYSPKRMVPTYTKSQITAIKNNYNGATPDAAYVSGWKLQLEGLDSGLSVSLDIRTLMNRFSIHDQITPFVCVEGWSAIAWWAGLRFDDLIQAYPPKSQAKWARVESSVNLDNSGNPDPYFVSIDLATARHPQTLLVTHHDGQPLTVEHGAPLRLLVPVKLGLKNVKAITRITYSAQEPKDYWSSYGYSSYDGI